jgi:hypothetical protein
MLYCGKVLCLQGLHLQHTLHILAQLHYFDDLLLNTEELGRDVMREGGKVVRPQLAVVVAYCGCQLFLREGDGLGMGLRGHKIIERVIY